MAQDNRKKRGELVSLRLLGRFELRTASGDLVPVRNRKNIAILSIIGIAPRQIVARARLCDLLWTEKDEAAARACLRQSLSVLRREMGAHFTDIIVAQDASIGLKPGTVAVDVLDFLEYRNADNPETLRDAARLYQGEFAEGLDLREQEFSDWLSAERQHFRALATDTLEKLCRLESGTQRLAAARQLLALDPYREAAHRALMTAYAAMGERALALRQFETCRTMLLKEFGVGPAAETEAVRQRLTQDGVGGQKEARPSLVVLPFGYLGEGRTERHLADGITEDVITALSRFRGLTVIGRSSSFVFQGRKLAAAEIMRELGVKYMVEGSIRTANGRLRISARLSEGEDGRELWA